MTPLLAQAIAAIESLPAEVQDAIAARIIAEAADERAWDEQFRATTDAQWKRLAEEVQRSIAAHSTTPLAEGFPPSEP
jgi:hypothetical protein